MIEFGLSLDAVLPESLPENLTWLMLDAPLLGDPPRWPAQPRALHRAAAQIAREQGLAENGFRLITNCGRDGAQSVNHLHFHLLGGKQLSETMA